MRFGISHNGFVYTVEQDSVWEIFKVSLDVETEWLTDPEDSESWADFKATVDIGKIDMRNAHFYGWFECQTRWNSDRMTFSTDQHGINDAVAFLAKYYRPCEHGNSAYLSDGADLWVCDDCGGEFKMLEDDE